MAGKERHTILETERLKLSRFTFHDTSFIIELLNSPGWLQFIGDRKVTTEDHAKAYLQNGPLKSYLLNGYGLCKVELKMTGAPVGMCGILNREQLEWPDIGFALLPRYTRNGYAFEIVSATLLHARQELKLATIAAITLPSNQNSINLLLKAGFCFIHTFSFPGEKELLKLYTNP